MFCLKQSPYIIGQIGLELMMSPRLGWNSWEYSCYCLLRAGITGSSHYFRPEAFFTGGCASLVILSLDLIPAIFSATSKTLNYISQSPFQVASMKVQPVRLIGRTAGGRKREKPHISAHSALSSISAPAASPACSLCFPSYWRLPFLCSSSRRDGAVTANL